MAQVLRDEEIEAILAAGKDNKRSRKRPLNSLTLDYETKLRKNAEKKTGQFEKTRCHRQGLERSFKQLSTSYFQI